MKRISVGSISLAIAVVGVAALLPADEPKQDAKNPPLNDKAFHPIQSVEHLMEGQDMLYKQIKDDIGDKEWRDARTCAWLLAELANVNQYQSKEKKYQDIAGRMSVECTDLARLLGKRKADDAQAQVTKISQTCKACHDVYRRKSN